MCRAMSCKQSVVKVKVTSCSKVLLSEDIVEDDD